MNAPLSGLVFHRLQLIQVCFVSIVSQAYACDAVEYRTLKERRLFGRSKGYRDLTLAGTEDEKPAERYVIHRTRFDSVFEDMLIRV
jgi:hypothetical protein